MEMHIPTVNHNIFDVYRCEIFPFDASDFWPSENVRPYWSEVNNAEISFACMITIALHVIDCQVLDF